MSYLRFLIGSQNYGLDHNNSDKDFYIYAVPSLSELINNTILTKDIAHTNGIAYYKSIQNIQNMIEKSSPNQLEILYSIDVVEDGCQELYNWMKANAEDICRANLPRLAHSILGELNRRVNELKKGKCTASTQHLFAKYRYDTKNAAHAFRLAYIFFGFIIKGYTFEHCLRLTDPLIKEKILSIKRGEISPEAVIKTIDEDIAHIVELLPNVKEKYTKNEDMYDTLKDLVYDTIVSNVKEEVLNENSDL